MSSYDMYILPFLNVLKSLNILLVFTGCVLSHLTSSFARSFVCNYLCLILPAVFGSNHIVVMHWTSLHN